ncbi:MAG TPA: outer membrane lipoprotein-sorting protein [Crenotrichaceae bacterium]|nr:outer membrane lipoprotein-sorting protein [Crenotrichaceae bacterium]
MNNKQWKQSALLMSLLLFVWIGGSANELPDGDSIAQRINARDEGVSVSRDVKMEMTDKRGKTRIRETSGYRKYYDDEKRTIIIYRSPKNVKDTGFLTFDYADPEKDDDQWLYLPAMRKVRRISASDRGDYFLGTDFSYEDIKLETRVSIKDYTRKTIGEDVVNDHHCLLVEMIPVNETVAKELGYGKAETCVDDSIWIVRRSRIWDVQGNPLKTTINSDIRQVQGIWTVHRMQVENHKTGHQTVFTFRNVDYQAVIDDNVFTKQRLKRGL